MYNKGISNDVVWNASFVTKATRQRYDKVTKTSCRIAVIKIKTNFDLSLALLYGKTVGYYSKWLSMRMGHMLLECECNKQEYPGSLLYRVRKYIIIYYESSTPDPTAKHNTNKTLTSCARHYAGSIHVCHRNAGYLV